MKFVKCEICGNMLGFVEDKGQGISCCGHKMSELIPGSVDASVEKHLPVAIVEGNKVTIRVGSVPHPMTSDHYIGWVALETKDGNQRKLLQGTPETEFFIGGDDEITATYAYCNLHGLWKS